jgi:hypothetical protein
MTRRQVTCISKRDRQNPHERIEGIGGPGWYETEDAAIRGIENRTMSFYTYVNGREAALVVAEHNRRKYLKTTADGYAPNNLLCLSACPIRQAA